MTAQYGLASFTQTDEGTPRNVREETLLDRFNRYFACALADEPIMLRRALQTRYQVYCVENAFENPADHPNGLETDDYDSQSVHSVLLYRPTGDATGAVRLILPDLRRRLSPAVEHILESEGRLPFPVATTAEVSRFSICKRQPQSSFQTRLAFRRASANDDSIARHTGPLMSLGLIQGTVRMSIMHRITHWCAIIEPKFLRMLAAMGIHFTPIGPLVEHHGLRQPCYCHVESILENVRNERPSFWEVLTDGGNLCYAQSGVIPAE